MGASYLNVAIGSQHHEASADQIATEVHQQVKSPAIGVVQILEHEHGGSA